MLNSGMHSPHKIERSAWIKINQQPGDVVVDRLGANLERVPHVVVKNDGCTRPQLRFVLQGKVQAALATSQHEIDSVTLVLLPQQGDQLSFRRLWIAEKIQCLAVEIQWTGRKSHQRFAERLVHDRGSRKQEIRVVQNHDPPGLSGLQRVGALRWVLRARWSVQKHCRSDYDGRLSRKAHERHFSPWRGGANAWTVCNAILSVLGMSPRIG